MDNTPTQNIISLCTGYGGLELGLRRISPDFRTVAYVEIEAFACANLVAKIEQGQLDAAPIWTDIKTFDGKPFRGKVDGLLGGYPCQPFSNAGQRKGTDDPRHLWPYIEKHIRTIRPVWCFFENVSGHLTLGFKEVFHSLRDMGYSVEAGLFTAAEVGAPHKRERLFILGYAGQFAERLQGCRLSSRQIRCQESVRADSGNRPADASQLAKSIGKRAGSESGTAERENRSSVLRQGNGQAGTGRVAAASELAYARHLPRCPELRQQQKECSKEFHGGDKLANTESERTQRNGTEGVEKPEIYAGQKISMCNGRGNQWPARPGQEQYDWEEPRTAGKYPGPKPTKVEDAAKFSVGRNVDGFASRVDELRLLGNGVVPETAELAFSELWKKILSDI